MDTIVGVSEFREQAKRLIDQLGNENVIVVRHNTPVAVLIHPDRLEQLYSRIEDLEDELAIHQADGNTVPLDVARKELLGDG